MHSISPTLQAHQRAQRRIPAPFLSATAQRAGLQLLRWQPIYTGTEPDVPHAATLATDGALIRARNTSGTLHTSRTPNPGPASPWSTWATTATGLLPGSGIALARNPLTAELLLAYTTGAALLIRTSTDHGATWSSPTTLLTEATNLGAITAAFNPTGNCAIFYTLGTTPTLKRLRRTAGTWAPTATTWTRTADAATLTGIAATHNGADFQLILTGTAPTTNHPRAWGALMGDLGLPTDAWSTLNPIAEADAASGTTYTAPAIAIDRNTALRGAITVTESGNAPYTRPAETAAASGLATSPWTEPTPHEAPHALALALDPTATTAWATTPAHVWRAILPPDDTLSPRLLTARYRITPDSAHCTVQLDNTDGHLTDPDHYPTLFPGATLNLWPGYATGPSQTPEYGIRHTFAIDRLTQHTTPSRRTLQIDATAGWELLARWRAPQAWQVDPGILSRGAIINRLANRAGIDTIDAGTSPDWTAYKPSFVLAAGETAATALRRLLTVVPDGVRTAEFDALAFLDIDPTDPPTHTYGPTSHPITHLQLIDQIPTANWVRLQGPDRYADHIAFPSLYQHGPILHPLRNLDASTNSRVIEGAEAAHRRHSTTHPRGQLTAPFDTSVQLFDVITIEGHGDYRVIATSLDYARGPQGARYDTILELSDP